MESALQERNKINGRLRGQGNCDIVSPQMVGISMLISRRSAWYSVCCKSHASIFCATTAWKIMSASGLPCLVPLCASWSTISHAKCTCTKMDVAKQTDDGQERPDRTRFQAKLQSNEMLQHQSQSVSRCPKQGQDFCHIGTHNRLLN